MGTVTLVSRRRDVPEHLVIHDREIHRGGEGSIFFTTDDKYAVKIYHCPSKDKKELLQKILDLGCNLGEDEQFLALPIGIIERFNDKPVVGVVTRRIPDTHLPLYKLMYSPEDAVEQFRQGRSWIEYLKIARGVASAVRTLHGKGMAHADLHLKNFLANPASGEVVLIDLDGLVVKGFLPPQVKGMMGFIAPEVVMGLTSPDELTDRHSLAVLVLWTLLFRNVMQTQKCYDPDDEKHDDELGYGEYACFSENPEDKRNWLPQIGIPLFRKGALSYRSLTPKLQELTERALIYGLHNPSKRPQAVEWERALAEAYDLLVICHDCPQSFFYPYWVHPPQRRQCPFCGANVKPPFPVVLELQEARPKGMYIPIREVILYQNLPLFIDIAEPGHVPPFTRRGTPKIGRTIWDPKEGVHRLINESDSPWQVLSPVFGTVGRGDSVALKRGTLLSLGEGKRLIRVIE